MTEVISVRFRNGCKSYFFSPGEEKVKTGDEVVVETAQGAEFGVCSLGNHQVMDDSVVQPLRPLIRMATEADRRAVESARAREKDAFSICEEKIAAHGLDMKLVNVECSFEGGKMIFFFTADGRVDFRELVKDLAAQFHSRIELRQIGVRDESKMLGGLGVCGRPFCCSGFLDEFQPVSIKMAKTQNLSLNPTKISGTCGRLMCCLKYEQFAYEDAARRMCRSDSFVQTPDGPGNVTAVNLVKETVTVRLDDAPEAPKSFGMDELVVLRSGKGSRDGIDIPPRPARIVRETPESEKTPDPVQLFDMSAPAAEEYTPRPRRDNRRPQQQKPRDARQNAPRGDVPKKPDAPRKPDVQRKPDAPKPPQQKDAPKQIVRFASNIPVAGNAAQGANAGAGDGEEKRRRRPHRRGRRKGRGGEGQGGSTPKAE